MKIGFDISQTGRSKAGCGYFADSLINELAAIDQENHYLLYPTFGNFFWDPHWESEVTRIHQPRFTLHHGHKTLAGSQHFWENAGADFEKKIGDPDIVHANNFFCPMGLVRSKLIYTLYDLTFLEHPELTTEENRTGCFQGVFEASHRADMIVAISAFSRDHFLTMFPHYPAERIRVVYPASRFALDGSNGRRPDAGIPLHPERFWLSVGTLEPRKNHIRLLRAYAALKAEGKGCLPLVMAGGAGWMMDDFKKTVAELGLNEDVQLLGYVGEDEIRWLYKNCYALLYPSIFEGFGLPVLEAMSLGAAVITSNVTSLPEIIGDAGLLVDPFSIEDMARTMKKMITNPELRGDLKTAARKQVGKFSWLKAAREVKSLYNHAVQIAPLSLSIMQKGLPAIV